MSVQEIDPLEDVLALVGTTGRMSVALAGSGEWAVVFEPPDGVKFNAVRSGRCLLSVDGLEPIALAPGDCFLLIEPRAFTLASGPGVATVPAGPLFRAAQDGIARAGIRTTADPGMDEATKSNTESDDDVFIIGGRFDFGHRAGEILLAALPPVIHVPGDTPAAGALRWALDLIDTEMRDRPMGSTLVTEHLAMVMLIHILRLVDAPPTGWLAGLGDPVVAPALRVMHARPADPWTVADLARTAAVSRSTLAARFRQVVGRSPLDYLTGWRIELAADRLRRDDGTVAVIARGVGYRSESALSNAFKRVTGQSPREYRRSLTVAPPPDGHRPPPA
ncbi:AraC family transcriptional regulator [Actinoplanes palleronii]|uniref:AraC family transcriptional regulator n=1 Tax=Actinoplanes palleronii TaxID=113570 RepID=A0ABQ4BPG2_9ACTN|nr:AraC family transcriptional regulator [Actinoplanes palleronii]GIE72554.1 AraC family transcriptional regulator [Actinoplanes palleronii]